MKMEIIDFAEIEARVAASWTKTQSNVERATLAAYVRRYLYATEPKRKKGMFTKQHYVAVANLLRTRREEIRAEMEALKGKLDPFLNARLNENNEAVMRFANLFKQDCPRFRELIFIGEACAGDIADTGTK